MENKFKLSDIKGAEPKQLIDWKKYEGQRVKILHVSMTEMEDHYINGTFNATEFVMAPAILVETEPADASIIQVDEKGVKYNPTIVRQTLKLLKKINPDTKQEEIYFSKHKNSKVWKLMRKVGANNLDEIEGKSVVILTEPSKDPADDRVWPRLVI